MIKKLLKKSSSLESQGSSMLPIIKESDVVYFKKKRLSKIKEHDILVFFKNKKIICHRVIYKDKKNRFLITRGDNNLKDDGKIYQRHVLGVVTKIKRKNKIIEPENLYLIQSTCYFEEILKLKEELEKKKIDHLFLKGLPVHLYYEAGHPRRIYADCDLLLEKENSSKLNSVFSDLGFKKIENSLLNNLVKMKQENQIQISYAKITYNLPIIIDVHFYPAIQIVHLNPIDILYPRLLLHQLTQEMMKRKRKIKVCDKNFFVLREDYLFVYLCLHLFHHNFSGSFRYRLIERILTKKKASQKKLLKISQEIISRFKLEGFVYPVGVFLRKYYYPLPPSFLSKIKPKGWLKEFYTRKFLLKINIFSDRSRVYDGVFRFINLLILSPSPLWKKIFVFFNPEVILAVCFVFYTKIKTFLFGLKRFYPHVSITQ